MGLTLVGNAVCFLSSSAVCVCFVCACFFVLFFFSFFWWGVAFFQKVSGIP